MDSFLIKYSDKNIREKRISSFFKNFIYPSLKLNHFKNLNLEIGCGHGHWLNAYSKSYKEDLSIGIDLNTKRIEKAKSKKFANNLENLFFLKTEAIEFLTSMPKDLKFSNFFIFFPDPWPKNRHHKRRLIQPHFLEFLELNSTPKSKLFFRTDHNEYFKSATQIIHSSKNWTLCESTLPIEISSFFQDLLPNFLTLSAIKR